MSVLVHIVIALSSVLYTTYLYFFPSKSKLKFSYILVAATFLTGFYLAFSKPAHMLEVCVMGLLYIGAVSFGLISVHKKLAHSSVSS